jgi:rhamnose transport system substrate-binding protein
LTYTMGMRSYFVATSIVAAVLLFGCSSGGADKGASAPGSNSGSSRLKVVFIPKSSGNTYFDEIDRGFQDASKQFGFDYKLQAPGTADATSQVPIVTDQIQNGVNVIAISANSPDALDSVLDQARSKGIVVITVDSDIVGNESHRDAAVLPTNFQAVGPDQIALLALLMGYQGDFAILSATTDSPNQNAWLAGMKEELKQPKYAKMKLVDTVYGDDEAQKSTTECDGLLARYPNLGGIISPTSVGLAACAQVVERSGIYPGGPHAVGKGLELTGLSTPVQLKKFVKSGVVTSFQLWSPYNEGFLAGYLGPMIYQKKIVPKAGLIVDVPVVGKRGFTPKLEIVGGPMLTFNKSNIYSYKF